MPAGRLLLVGLGNPGPKYAGNRHNIGFMALDAVVRRHGFGSARARFHGELATGQLAGRETLALKPLTYMNESGRSVAEAARFFKIEREDVFVFHDELDLAAGRLRVKQGGGAAGHNGLRSIDALFGNAYWRVRLGIGHPGDKRRVLGHVLDDFDELDRPWLEPLLAAVGDNAALLATGDPAAFASKVALALAPPKPERPSPTRVSSSQGERAGVATETRPPPSSGEGASERERVRAFPPTSKKEQ